MVDTALDLHRRAALPKRVKGMGAISAVLARAGVTEHDCFLAGHFARAFLENPASVKYLADAEISLLREKASGESIGGGGAVLVPPEIEPSIISLRDNNGIARQFAHVIQMGSDERHWPRRVAGATARFVTAENATIVGSQLNFDDIALFAKKAAAAIQISNELYEDEIVGFGAYFLIEVSTAFWRSEDDCTFVGDGSSAYGGIRGICNLLVDSNHTADKAAAAATHSGLDKIDGPDLAALMGLLPSYAWPNAPLVHQRPRSRTLSCQVGCDRRRLVGVAPDGLAFAGFPISIVPSMPGAGSQVGKIVMAFGDLSLAVAIGSRRGVTVGISDHRYLEFDQTAMRGTERFDVVCANLGDYTNPGPIVGLTATA